MAAQPKISVILPCFNDGEFLLEALASVTSAQRRDLELIVINDGSTDERTRKELDSLDAGGIHVIHQENKGLAAARNAAILASKGEYILPLDADNRIRPAYIEHGIRILSANPEIGVVYGDAQRVARSGATDPQRPAGRWQAGPFSESRLLTGSFIDACAVYRRVIWDQVGGYDGTMPVQGLEDWDFWLGALAHGWQFCYVPEVLFEYSVREDSMITRTYGSESAVVEFVAKKHGLLYRDAWLKLSEEHKNLQNTLHWERESVKINYANLRRLLKARIKQKIQRNG